MRSEHTMEVRGVNKTVNVSANTLQQVDQSLGHLAGLLDQDITAVIHEFKHRVATVKTTPTVRKELQALLQKTCDQLLTVSWSKAQTNAQPIVAFKKTFEENWSHVLYSWKNWSSKTAHPGETQLKNGLLILFDVIETIYKNDITTFSNQLINAAVSIDNHLKGIRQTIHQHDKRVDAFKQNCLEKINETNKRIRTCLRSTAWRFVLKQINNYLQALIFQFDQTVKNIIALNETIYIDIPQTCFALSDEKYHLMCEANQILTADKNEQALEKLTALEHKCDNFRQKVNHLSETYIHHIDELQTLLSTQKKEQVDALYQYESDLRILKDQVNAVASTINILIMNIEENNGCADVDVNKIKAITLQAKDQIKEIILEVKQYQESIDEKLNHFIEEIKNKKMICIEMHDSYEDISINELNLIIDKINWFCPQARSPNYLSDTSDGARHHQIDDISKKYYQSMLITIQNIQSYQRYLSDAFTMIERATPVDNIPKNYKNMKDGIQKLLNQLTTLFDELTNALNHLMHQEKRLVETFGKNIENYLLSINQFRTDIENAGNINSRDLVEKTIGIYRHLPFNHKKQHGSIIDEIQKRKAAIESRKENDIYQALQLLSPKDRANADIEHKIIYLKMKCQLYRKHLVSRGKSAQTKLEIIDLLYQILIKPSGTDQTKQLLAFESQLNLFEKQLTTPRTNALTKFLKAAVSFVLPFNPVRKKSYHVEGADFVAAVKSAVVNHSDDSPNRPDSTTYMELKLFDNNLWKTLKQTPKLLKTIDSSDSLEMAELNNHSLSNPKPNPLAEESKALRP